MLIVKSIKQIKLTFEKAIALCFMNGDDVIVTHRLFYGSRFPLKVYGTLSVHTKDQRFTFSQ